MKVQYKGLVTPTYQFGVPLDHVILILLSVGHPVVSVHKMPSMRGPENMFVEKEGKECTEWGWRVGLPRNIIKVINLSNIRKSQRMPPQEQTHKLLTKIVINWVVFTSRQLPTLPPWKVLRNT